MGGLLFIWTAPYQTCLKRACVPYLLSDLYQSTDWGMGLTIMADHHGGHSTKELALQT